MFIFWSLVIISFLIFTFYFSDDTNDDNILYIKVKGGIDNEKDFIEYLLFDFDYDDLVSDLYNIVRKNDILITNFTLFKASLKPGGDIFNYIFSSFAISNLIENKDMNIELKIDNSVISILLKKLKK